MNIDPKNIHICDDWISIAFHNLVSAHRASHCLRKSDQWHEVVAGMDSVAIQFDPAETSPEQVVRDLLKQLADGESKRAIQTEPISIPVCYDSQLALDLEHIAARSGITVEAIADWHSSLEFSVSMLGFMPGFAYLQCDEAIANIGRLDQPRQHVPAGSIGIIGDQSCIYPFDSPGGWPIIGRTPVALFDKSKDQSSLLTAGQTVKFTAIDRGSYDKMIASNS